VVVATGVTTRVPLVELTEPMPLIETEVAPVIFHCSVEDWPELMVAGVAVKEVTTGAIAGLTVTVADEVTEPASLVAVGI